MNYLDSKNIFKRNQFGVWPNHGTFQALNLFSTDVYSALDDKRSLLAVFIDFTKAFGTVNHNILLDKLFHYGIRGSILSWFQNYITNRHQQPSFNGQYSSYSETNIRVSQRSVLGPLLFLLYINDISDIFKESKTVLFADVMTFYITGPNPDQTVDKANNEPHKLFQWWICNSHHQHK